MTTAIFQDNRLIRPQDRPVVRQIMARLPRALLERGLEPAVGAWVYSTAQDLRVLFAVLDVEGVGRMERYIANTTLHQLSTALEGLPVVVSNTDGLRYAVILSDRPLLPARAEFPGCKQDLVSLGIGSHGPVAVNWQGQIVLGNTLVVGSPGSGKSNFLQLLALQAIRDDHRLLVADPDGRTFPMLVDSPALDMPVASEPEEVADLVARGLGECEHRAVLYETLPGYPDDLPTYNAAAVKAGTDPLQPVTVILDELNSSLDALGGPRSKFGRDLARLARIARKFGVTLVGAAHEFSMADLGNLRRHITTAVAFRVASRDLARQIGCAGAHLVGTNRPGRAVTNRWGNLQTYLVDKADLEVAAPILTVEDRELLEWARENDGVLSIPILMRYHHMQEWPARKLLEEWSLRGWVVKSPTLGNARTLTPRAVAMLQLSFESTEI